MPILKPQHDLFPDDLLDDERQSADPNQRWWCLYTRSRREKDLVRKLYATGIPYYCPTIAKRYRSPNGRMRTSYIPLFTNYVFLFGDETARYQAMGTNCISQYSAVQDAAPFLHDLRQIRQAIEANVPLTPEARLAPGDRVRVRSGPFKYFEGTVIRREGKARLLLALRFLEQGVSMEVDENLLEIL